MFLPHRLGCTAMPRWHERDREEVLLEVTRVASVKKCERVTVGKATLERARVYELLQKLSIKVNKCSAGTA